MIAASVMKIKTISGKYNIFHTGELGQFKKQPLSPVLKFKRRGILCIQTSHKNWEPCISRF